MAKLYINDRGAFRQAEDGEVIRAANRHRTAELAVGRQIAKTDDVVPYLETRIGGLAHEVFCAIWLDGDQKILRIDELFRGSLGGAVVYPREILKAALETKASGVIFAHNHPSGQALSSAADRNLTDSLNVTLNAIGVRLCDHVIIASEPYSMRNAGLIANTSFEL